ncbi:MAG: C4-dicarboxylate ABC transporter [Deltaproteobacteria bacterium]|nr:MAG: C4-dicarboxylate ABC transporter [Deltaproteobacteria bacterium]
MSQAKDLEQSRAELDSMVKAEDAGGREPVGISARLLFVVGLTWSLFQIYIATPLPFVTDFLLLTNLEQRVIHLAFALCLVYCFFPLRKKYPKKRISIYDLLLVVLGVCSCLYIVFNYQDIANRGGAARNLKEIVVATVGLLVLFEATRRAVGLPLVLVGSLFICYAFGGRMMPEIVSHGGISVNRFIEHMWFSTEGVFGLPIGVSNSFIFLYVLFGTLLDRAGAGAYFIRLSFSLFGHLQGGPAKAAVVSSAMTGLISGSAIANVVTTGTFTIPLMKKMGFRPEKAAAVEVSSSINGQIMPPVMGAAAFIMTEYVGISYYEVIKHAFFPAVLAYFGLYCIVHFEAVKSGMPTFAKDTGKVTKGRQMLMTALGISVVVIALCLTYFLLTAIKAVCGDKTLPVVILLVAATFVGMARMAIKYENHPGNREIGINTVMPQLLPTFMSGIYFLLPMAVLIWCLMIERWSPELSVIWAIAMISAQIILQKPLMRLLKREKIIAAEITGSVQDLARALNRGARNMAGVVIAMAAAGIIVGVVSVTGLGMMMVQVIETVAGGSVLGMLIFTALMCIVLGMGLPTTANYIVVASVMSGPLVILASQNGIIVPLIAVHLFVFYFGLISGTTPPVAVDAYAGAAVAGSDPVKTCLYAFFYDLRTSLLPFFFIFNSHLLLIGFDHYWEVLISIVSAVFAMIAFASGTQGFLLLKNRKWESLAMLLIAFSLIRPGFWLDKFQHPYQAVSMPELYNTIEAQPDGRLVRFKFTGENFAGEEVERVVLFPLGHKGEDGVTRLQDETGLVLTMEGRQMIVDDISFGSKAQQAGVDFGWQLLWAQVEAKRIAKQWFYLPAFFFFLIIWQIQRHRRNKETVAA